LPFIEIEASIICYVICTGMNLTADGEKPQRNLHPVASLKKSHLLNYYIVYHQFHPSSRMADFRIDAP
jgi:hypothetical protein